MKVGDMVKFSEINKIWYLARSLSADGREMGIIVDKNTRYFFVRWETGELHCQYGTDLDLVSEN